MAFLLSCTVCNRPFSLWENLTNRLIQLCQACNRRLSAFQEDTLAWIEHAFQEPAGVSEDIEQAIYEQLELLHVPLSLEEPILSRLGYLRHLTKIKQGDFPHIRIPNHLDTDEYAHFEIQATSISQRSKQGKYVPGRLIGTSKKLYFISDSGTSKNATLSWQNISQTQRKEVTLQSDGYTTTYQVLRILVSRGQGGGDYDVPDILFASTIIDALVKHWRRQLVEKRSTRGSVPDHIKAQVYQRDGGRCVECGFADPYIEFDHRHPRAKGGSHEVRNVQLLCRGCNRRKGDRI